MSGTLSHWRWWAGPALFLCGFLGLLAGVDLSERPGTPEAGWATKAYYALGLFVVGGLDIGVPRDGPLAARALLWAAYFGAPLFTASAVIEAIIQVMSPDRWKLRRVSDHTIIFGSGRLTLSYLRLLVRESPDAPIIVVDSQFDPVRQSELEQKFKATTVVGDLTHDYLLHQLRLSEARRVLLLGEDDFQACEAATRILDIAPGLRGRVILHCRNLRFLRSLQDTDLAVSCDVFNAYNLAATGLVHTDLIEHFRQTETRDTVVMAGFGRFGQSVLEELQRFAAAEIAEVAVIDIDADRRVLVVDEQARIDAPYERKVFQGDISHPRVWDQLAAEIDLSRNQPTIILGTGDEQNNLRTALWLKQRYPNAKVLARTNDISKFALAVGGEHGIKSMSITQLVEDHIPARWLT